MINIPHIPHFQSRKFWKIDGNASLFLNTTLRQGSGESYFQENSRHITCRYTEKLYQGSPE